MRLMTYNIHKGIGGRDRRYRLERIIEVLEAENPDIICLQEVDRNVRRSMFHDQPQLLGDYFNAVGRLFQLNVHLKTGGYGNLVLTRWPMRTTHQISLTIRNKKPRGAQMATIETPEGVLHLVHWHLGLAEYERHWQVRRVLEHHLFRESAAFPTIMTGDCNDWRNTLWRGPFAVHRFTQVTTPASRFRSFPAYMPMGSLDKAFCRGDLTVTQARICNHPQARWASDHRPLVIDFHINGHAPAEIGEADGRQ